MASLITQIRRYFPDPVKVDGRERARSILGAILGIFITGACGLLIIGSGKAQPWLVASMGASAVLVFAAPTSPLAQPWSVFGGNLVSAVVGVTCATLVGNPLAAASIAVGIAIAMMFTLRCIHPPGGAVALGMALGGPVVAGSSHWFILLPIALNSLVLLMAAIGYNNLCGRRYPYLRVEHGNQHQTADALPTARLGVTSADLDAVLKQYNQMLDISHAELEEILLRAEAHAYQRRFGRVTCQDIMSRDVVKVEFGTPLQDAWRLLREHKLKALPVANRFNRVIGIVTLHDFIRQLQYDEGDSLSDKLRRLIRPTPHTHSDKPEVVGQIMTKTVRTALFDQSILHLVPLFSDSGLHHIPIVDHNQRLVGMLTQSDVVAALYRSQSGIGRDASNDKAIVLQSASVG
jgi:CBS domain-containing membrane protein